MKRSGIQLAYPLEERRLMRWKPPFIVQPKLDGRRCRAVWASNSYVLISSECNKIFNLDHIVSQLNTLRLERHDCPDELDGELYVHGWSFEEIMSVTSREETPHPNAGQMEYHIFDVINDKPQHERLRQVGHLTTKPSLMPVPSELAHNLEQILWLFNSYLEAGYEGIILREHSSSYRRQRSPFMMKFKPKKHDDYLIVGFVEEEDKHGNPKGTLGSLLCVSDTAQTFGVGSGFTHRQRQDLWLYREDLLGKTCRVAHQAITPGRGVPRFPIFVEVL